MTFARRTDLALSALRALAGAEGRMSRSALALEIGTTPSFVAQVMSPLVEEGWVVSERGPGGGYELTAAADDVRLLEILEATEGPAENGRCVLRGGPCPGEDSCPIHLAWVEARQVLVDRLRAIPVLQT